jgi:polyisoprenoid-binding protein YceI
MAMTRKLMHVKGRCLLRSLAAGFSACLLAGCPVRPPAAPALAASAPSEVPAPHLGRPYDIVPQESLLTILVFRGGTLASAGHNHVIASHSLSGTIYLPQDLAGVSFEAHVPLLDLSVDEAALRAGEENRDFPPDVPDTAREGTRRNMLGAALLDAADYPQITLRALSVAPAADGTLQVRVQAEVRGQQHSLLVPVRYQRSDSTVIAAGEFPLKQTTLGLTPFSAMLGALQVQDEMRVRFRIVARAAR